MKGYTLIEAMIVIVMLAILVMLALPAYKLMTNEPTPTQTVEIVDKTKPTITRSP